MKGIRIGEGFDVHRLVNGGPLILGGVTIPFAKGLEGHSDADVLLHAVCDALLGAAALGDIGTHFPDSSMVYKNISSLKLLEQVREILMIRGYQVVNVDSTLILEAPRIAEFMPQMSTNIAQSLNMSSEFISVKATTTEGLGFAGRGEGVAARAIALIIKE